MFTSKRRRKLVARGHRHTVRHHWDWQRRDWVTIRSRLNPFSRARFRPGDVTTLTVAEPRGLNLCGALAFDFGQPGRPVVLRVTYWPWRRGEFAALVRAGGWQDVVVK